MPNEPTPEKIMQFGLGFGESNDNRAPGIEDVSLGQIRIVSARER
jgi:hypothetical protein